jgi:NAD(P)-dependent dehydrogenase (short-subunit alcohol dehydrogenase family)
MSVHELDSAFRGKTVIVTGAASGIGREIARQCAQAGAEVLLTDVVDSVHDAAAQIGNGASSQIVDVSDRDQVAGAIDSVVADHGSLDFIFNNAGVAIFGEVDVVTLDDWDKIIDVNLKGVAYGAKLAYDQMVKQGSGHIINTASVAGLVPVPLQTSYVATKFAVVGLGKTLEVEAREHGVHVTTFCPAFIDTGMIDNNTLRGTMDVPNVRSMIPIKPQPADKAVQALLAGVVKNKSIVITPFYGRIGWWLERFAPSLAMRQHRLFLSQTRKRAARQKGKRAAAPENTKTPVG